MIGIDITFISRIEKLYNRWGEKGLAKFLSKKEIALGQHKITTYSGFWAAKEAASKALGSGIGKICGFHDIKIKKLSSGQPTIKYKKHIRKAYKIKSSHLSITHDGDVAIAVVVNVYKK
ncbi:MAG: holo-ACP synthase [Arcobacteraceae bacterium]|jgi:holo-[acyl-carrier protein] synthase|nr:holo-ACP synthase [Arcobacteraceae bacterium]